MGGAVYASRLERQWRPDQKPGFNVRQVGWRRTFFENTV